MIRSLLQVCLLVLVSMSLWGQGGHLHKDLQDGDTHNTCLTCTLSKTTRNIILEDAFVFELSFLVLEEDIQFFFRNNEGSSDFFKNTYARGPPAFLA